MAVAADTFYEPFTIPPQGCPVSITDYPGGPGTYPFPPGWTLFNVDGRTPAGAVAYVNDAWEAREDFKFNTANCAVFSTSWYNPPGQADDWMWSPPITVPASAVLSWNAVAYDPAYRDGYEVRVKTGAAPTLANQLTSTTVYSNPAEEAVWTQRSVDISSYGGQTVYVGFRNNSNDKFLLLVDDVRVRDVAADVAAVAQVPPFTSEYARAPLGMDVMPTLALGATNSGVGVLTNVVAIATPMLDGNIGGPGVVSTTVPTLPAGDTTPLTFGAPAAYSGAGTWSTRYTVSVDQTEPDVANNTVEVPGTTIGGNEFARWEGAASGALGIGAGNGGEMGVSFTLPVAGFYAGAHFAMAPVPPESGTPPVPNACPGFDYVLNLRAFDTVNNVPGAIIDTTTPIPCEYDSGGSYDVAFVHGQHELAAGTYVLTAVEPVGGPTLTLLLHDQRFVDGTTWVNWPTSPFGGWAHNEDFGVAAFKKTYELSLLQGEAPIFADGFDGAAPAKPSFRPMHGPAPAIVRGRPTRSVPPVQFAPSGNP
jgi:hypothetical protein